MEAGESNDKGSSTKGQPYKRHEVIPGDWSPIEARDPATYELREFLYVAAKDVNKTGLRGHGAAMELAENVTFTVQHPRAIFRGITDLGITQYQDPERGDSDKVGDDLVFLARVGPRGRTHEEALMVSAKDGPWRVSAPSELARPLKQLADAKALERHQNALTRLTEVLTKARDDVEAGRYRTRDLVLLRLAQLVADAKLADVLR